MTTLQTTAPFSATAARMSAPGTKAGAESNILADMQQIIHLLDFGQAFCQKGQRGSVDLCHEVERITQGRAYLRLGGARPRTYQLPAHLLITLPVQFGHVSYGALCITSDPLYPELPSMQLPIARLLALACSWLLHMFEQSIVLWGQSQQFEYQVLGPLTKREREVLQLIYQGYNREEIANRLSISPATLRKHRQHIYEQLGVHNERDALLAAYQGGLLSPFTETLE